MNMIPFDRLGLLSHMILSADISKRRGAHVDEYASDEFMNAESSKHGKQLTGRVCVRRSARMNYFYAM